MFDGYDYGLWKLIPDNLQTGTLSLFIGLVFTSATVYCMVEFSNAMVLLQISSRMLSCMLVFLMALSLCLHRFQPMHIVMLCMMLSNFALFASHQNPSPSLVFSSQLMISIASLMCPKFILMALLVWFNLGYLRALNARTFIGSIFALLVPYWFFFAFSVLNDRIDIFIDFFVNGIKIESPDFSLLTSSQMIIAVFTAITFFSGVVDYFITFNRDKIRQRTIYNAIIVNGFLTIALSLLIPQCFNISLGIFIIDTAIVGGRFWVGSVNRFTHIYFLLLTLFAFLILALTINM